MILQDTEHRDTALVSALVAVWERSVRATHTFLTDDENREHGVGKQLLEHGIAHHNVSELTVNEQNPQAIEFYQHMGFVTYRRTEQDEEGGPYPLLYMRLHQ